MICSEKMKLVLSVLFVFFLTSCGIYKPSDARNVSPNVDERVKQAIQEGRGFNLKKLGKGGTNFEFASSNELWRASLEVLDFIPMTTVDYAGGMIITDWYTDNNKNNESVKITLRFLANEVRSDSLKITVHKKTCSSNQACRIALLKNSKIDEELRSTILRKAALLAEKAKKKKK